MAEQDQGNTPETEISVDLNAPDPDRAVTRRPSSDIARAARDADGERSPTERAMLRRMNRFSKNLEKQFDQKLAEREAAWQRERSELEAKINRVSVDRDGNDSADAAHEAKIKELQDKLAAAYEKGDSIESAKITAEMSRLDAQFWAKKGREAGVTSRETAQPTTTTTTAKPSGPTAAGARFIRANEEWWDEPEFEVEKAAANTIYLKLVNQEGFDPKDDETFKEVAKQLKAKFPQLDARAGRRDPDEDDDEPSAQDRTVRRQAPAARLEDRGDASNERRSNRRVLTAQDKQTMRDCRLDPDNDRDVVQFLREAQAMEAAS